MKTFNLSEFLPYQLAVLAGRTSAGFSECYRDTYGFSIPEWRVMAHLNQEENVSVREIHQRVEMDKSKVSRAAQSLELKGFISKQTDPVDRRLVALSLTKKGKRTMAEIAPLADEFEERLLSVLEPDEQVVFLSAVEKLLHSGT